MEKLELVKGSQISWYVLGRDDQKSEHVIDTNEYLLTGRGESLVLDPGGTEIFPEVVAGLAEIVPIDSIKAYFCSHQDPDIMSSLPLWMGLTPKAQIYVSWVWSSFIAHFGHEYVERFITVPDEGISFQLAGVELRLIPAHYCHASGNFSLYDPSNKVLFSGDIGGALMPEGNAPLLVENFDAHIAYMEGFHRRWMPSNRAKNRWIERVRKLDVMYLCPQHGAIFHDQNVTRFLDWFEALEVGSAV